MFQEIDRPYSDYKGVLSPRLSYPVYDLENEALFSEFISRKARELVVPGSGRKVSYDAYPRTGVGLSKLGASKTIAIGAYAFALQQLDAGGI